MSTVTVRSSARQVSVSAKGPQGAVGIRWRDDVGNGSWLTGTAYAQRDGVRHGNPASSWRCIAAHTADAASEPGVGEDWDDYWVLLAEGISAEIASGSVLGRISEGTGSIEQLTAGEARSVLELGSMAVQDADDVAITGGSITGIGPLSISDYSLTGDQATSLVDLSGTWNTTGTPTAIRLDLTDTASNAASLLMDLRVGGASRFKVSKHGYITGGRGFDLDNGNQTNVRLGTWKVANGTGGINFLTYGSVLAGLAIGDYTPGHWNIAETNGGGLVIRSSGGIGVPATRGAIELVARHNAGAARAVVAIRGTGADWVNGLKPLLQTFDNSGALQTSLEYDGSVHVYNIATDTANYERGTLGWNDDLFEIGTSAAGTGTQRGTALVDADIRMGNLPTSDPGVAGRLWNDGGTLKISTGA